MVIFNSYVKLPEGISKLAEGFPFLNSTWPQNPCPGGPVDESLGSDGDVRI